MPVIDMREYPYHSGYDGLASGRNTTLKYYGIGGINSLEVKNYLQERASISAWFHNMNGFFG